MADEGAGDQQQAADGDQQGTDWPAEAARWKQLSRKNEERARSNAAAARRLDELESASKSETERLTSRASQAEKERDEALSEALRFRVASKKQLPDDLADRLRGTTEDELSEDADRLLSFVRKTGRPAGNVDQGSRTTPPAAADWLQQLVNPT